jgi:nicotinate phosphoribosyltransferase
MIIKSLLDTDLYKLTMQQAVFHRYPGTRVSYEFINRTSYADLLPYKMEIAEQIDSLSDLTFTDTEINYLDGLNLFQADYLQMLRSFRLPKGSVYVWTDKDKLAISIHGPWWQTILFEVPILAIVNQCYYKHLLWSKTFTHDDREDIICTGRHNLIAKHVQIKYNAPENFKLMEFGTRRRFSRAWQREVLEKLLTLNSEARPKPIIGTSNVALAKEFGIQPMGTMAHEWLQAHQVLAPLKQFQQKALEAWLLEYRGKLGIALTDCINQQTFLSDFDPFLARSYDGVRHDSGDPHRWCDAMIAHYEKLGIDPRTKTAVFSDGLNIGRAIDLALHYRGGINTVFGIGTNLTNDFNLHPLAIVMKMVQCDGQPVAKISDEPKKAVTGNEHYLSYLKSIFPS